MQNFKLIKSVIARQLDPNKSIKPESLDKFVNKLISLNNDDYITSSALSSSLKIGVREAQELLSAAFQANLLRLFTVPRINGVLRFSSAKEGAITSEAFRLKQGHTVIDPSQIDRVVAFKKDSIKINTQE